MSARIFNGKLAAEEILDNVAKRIKKLKKAPKLLSFYNPKDSASTIYTRIKKQKAEGVGIEFQGIEIGWIDEAVQKLVEAGKERDVTGILVQHPTGEFAFEGDDWARLVNAINLEKDVDGLREDSPFVPATVKAILVALEQALRLPFGKLRIAQGEQQELLNCKIAVVGATGMVGSRLVQFLKGKGARVKGIDEITQDMWFQTKNSDVVISAVGKHNLIHGDMIKNDAVVIDVGSPGGDVNFESASAVASFITPVPGGIGPLTVACLLENTVLAAEKNF